MSFRQFGGKTSYDKNREIKVKTIVSNKSYTDELESPLYIRDVSFTDNVSILNNLHVDKNVNITGNLTIGNDEDDSTSLFYNNVYLKKNGFIDGSLNINTFLKVGDISNIIGNNNMNPLVKFITYSENGTSNTRIDLEAKDISDNYNGTASFILEPSQFGGDYDLNFWIGPHKQYDRTLSITSIEKDGKLENYIFANAGLNLLNESSFEIPLLTQPGTIQYDTTSKYIRLWNGTNWEEVGKVIKSVQSDNKVNWIESESDIGTIEYLDGNVKIAIAPKISIQYPQQIVQPLLLRKTTTNDGIEYSSIIGGTSGSDKLAFNNDNTTTKQYGKITNIRDFIRDPTVLHINFKYDFTDSNNPVTATRQNINANANQFIIPDSSNTWISPLTTTDVSNSIDDIIENYIIDKGVSINTITSILSNSITLQEAIFYVTCKHIGDNDFLACKLKYIDESVSTTITAIGDLSLSSIQSDICENSVPTDENVFFFGPTDTFSRNSEDDNYYQFGIKMHFITPITISQLKYNTQLLFGRCFKKDTIGETINRDGFFTFEQIYVVINALGVNAEKYKLSVGVDNPVAKLHVESDLERQPAVQITQNLGNQPEEADAALIIESTNANYGVVEIRELNKDISTSLFAGSGTTYSWLSRYNQIVTQPPALSIASGTVTNVSINNVGIKEPNPVADLHIHESFQIGNKYSDSGYIFNTYNGFGDAYGEVLVLGDYDDHTGIAFLQMRPDVIKYTTTIESVNGDLSIRTGDISFNGTDYYGINYMTTAYFDQSGNIGIGTTDPSGVLHIIRNNNEADSESLKSNVILDNNSAEGYSAFRLRNDQSSLGGDAVLFYNGSNRTIDGGNNTLTLRNDSGDVRIQSKGGFGKQKEGIFVQSNTQHVGIGTNNPISRISFSDSIASGLYESHINEHAPTDQKVWFNQYSDDSLINYIANDTNSTSTEWLKVTREGMNIVDILFPSGDITLHKTPLASGTTKSTISLRSDDTSSMYGGKISGYIDEEVGSGLILTSTNNNHDRNEITITDGNVNINGLLNVNGISLEDSIEKKTGKYNIPTTSGTANWWKLGFFKANQDGQTFMMKSYLHFGFNAEDSQDMVIEIYFKTSNSRSLTPSGFAGNSWYYVYGNNNYQHSIKWVSDKPGIDAEYFTLYMNLPEYTNNSHYIVSHSEGTLWDITESEITTDPGSDGASVHASLYKYNIVGGNVGIGTTTPDSTLVVGDKSSNNASILKVESKGLAGIEINGDALDSTGEPDGAYLVLTQDGEGDIQLQLSTVQNAGQDGRGNSYTGTTANSTLIASKYSVGKLHIGTNRIVGMTMDGTQRVGIGTSSPTQTLEVNGNIALGHRWNGATNTTDVNLGKLAANGSWGDGACYITFKDKSNTPSDANSGTSMIFNTHQWGVSTAERMRIAGNGNVGIGTTDPKTTLDIHGGLGITGWVNPEFKAGGGKGLWLGNNDTYTFMFGYNYDTGNGPKNIVLQEPGGNVGIGTISPEARLTVLGTNANGGIEVMQASSNHKLRFIANTDAWWWNPLTRAGDNAIIFTDGTESSSGSKLILAPWSSNSSGMIIDYQGNVSITGSFKASKIESAFDTRELKPSSIATSSFNVGFGSFNNNNTSAWADIIHLNTYADHSGGNQNAIFVNKSTIGMRIYQGDFQSTSNYTAYKDVVLADTNGSVTILESTGTSASSTKGTLTLEHNNNGGSSSIVFPSKTNRGSDYGYINFSDDGAVNGTDTENSLLTIGVENDADSKNADEIAIRMSGDYAMYFRYDRNVGIGTTNPSKKVTIDSGDLLFTGNYSPVLALNGDNTSNKPKFVIGEQQKYGLALEWDSGVTVYYKGYHNQDIFGDTSTTIGSINTQIGTFTWNKEFEVNGGWVRVYGNKGLYFENHGGGWFMSDSTWIRSYGNKNVYINEMLRADGGLQVGENGTKFIVNNSGHVGIGTTSPYGNLSVTGNTMGITPNSAGIHIGGQSNGDYKIEITSVSASTNSYIDFGYPNVDFRGRILYSNSSNTMDIYTSSKRVVSISDTLTTINNVHIGVYDKNPEYAQFKHSSLPDDGKHYAFLQSATGYSYMNCSPGQSLLFRSNNETIMEIKSGQASLNGNLIVSENITAFSDGRYKENVKPLMESLPKLCKLRGVYFNFKHNPNKKQIGFIAQEVEKEYPELVLDKDDKKTLNYQNMSAVLLEGIKELNEKVEKERREKNELKVQNENLQKRIELLENTLNTIVIRLDTLEKNKATLL